MQKRMRLLSSHGHEVPHECSTYLYLPPVLLNFKYVEGSVQEIDTDTRNNVSISCDICVSLAELMLAVVTDAVNITIYKPAWSELRKTLGNNWSAFSRSFP